MSAAPPGAAPGGGAGAVVRAGHLRKLKTMKKKFFVLRAEASECSARLEYYESEKKFRSGASPRRVVPLKSCYNITRRLDLKQKHVIALFTREEQFCVVADNEKDLHEWLTAILKHHRNDDNSEELLHPIQHVWQVNVQKKGLGASKNIQGLYNLCLTDKTLTLVKIKSHNNVISDLGIPERVEYSLKNIRRCGDSECFFYMEVGRSTATGAGELWMHSDDSNIAQSMHSTIYHAMRNCAKETENERDHIIVPKTESTLPARRQTYSDGRGRAGLSNDNKGLCVGSCIRTCVCAAEDSATGLAPLATHAENQPPNNSLTDKPERTIKHHRTISLPTGCPLFQDSLPLKIVHERTRSAPLTGDEVDRAFLEKNATHSSCKAVNGTDAPAKKSQWSRRASTGARLSKLSPAHSKNATTLRNRCDSMPSRASSSFEMERPTQRHSDLLDGVEVSRDETDSVEWHRTPRIPEEPDFCDTARDLMNTSLRGSIQHSRTSSMGIEDIALEAAPVPEGYLPMAPGHDFLGGMVSASSGSVCSGTPSTDPRFSEYPLEPVLSHIVDADERPPRAYSVGSRPAAREPPPHRHRAYSVGARNRPLPSSVPLRQQPSAVSSAPLLPRASAEDLMELDFSTNSTSAKVVVARTPPAPGFMESVRAVDEYVDMSPRSASASAAAAGYVEMRPGDIAPASRSPPAPAPAPPTPDGYVEMNYGRAPTRPIAIASARPAPPIASSPVLADRADRADRRRLPKEARTPLGSQTLFPISLDSPASPPELDAADVFDDDTPHSHPLTTVREISEEGKQERRSPSSPTIVAGSPSYVKLAYGSSRPIAAPGKPPDITDELGCNPTANKLLPRTDASEKDGSTTATVVLAGGSGTVARFSVGGTSPPQTPNPAAPAAPPAPPSPGGPLNYAALDLEPRCSAAAPPARTYTQIDFARSEKLHADAN